MLTPMPALGDAYMPLVGFMPGLEVKVKVVVDKLQER